MKWESDGQGEFTVEPAEKESRGTDVILHLREDAKEFLSSWRIREIVKQYSDFIDHPIVMDGKRRQGGRNAQQPTGDLAAAQEPDQGGGIQRVLQADCRTISRTRMKTIHIAAEGATEFRALLFIAGPSADGLDDGPAGQVGHGSVCPTSADPHQCEEVIPPYLRFVKGVVDSARSAAECFARDLQHNPLLAKIKSNLVNRILKTLEEMKSNEYDEYLKFYKEFGEMIKEGVGRITPIASGSPICCCSNPRKPSPANSPPWRNTLKPCRPIRRRFII